MLATNLADFMGMPRKQVPPSAEFPYHITVRCNNKDWFKLPKSEVWTIMEDYLHFAHHSFDARTLAFTLMDNHYHWLAFFPRANISETMNYFNRETSRQIGFEAGRINHIYKSPYHKTLIRSDEYLRAVYKYTYQNPVRAGICEKVEDYPFSTLYGLLGQSNLYIPVEEDKRLFHDTAECLEWLNQQPSAKSTIEIRKALRRSEFEICADKNTGKICDLEGYI